MHQYENLERKVYTNVDLSTASFVFCNLTGAQFINCDLTDATFLCCDLTHATFTGSTFNTVTFYSCIMANVKITHEQLHASDIHETYLRVWSDKNINYNLVPAQGKCCMCGCGESLAPVESHHKHTLDRCEVVSNYLCADCFKELFV